MGKKIGRNDPCPCGSGMKYKKCCGAEKSEGGYVQTADDWFPELTGTIWDEYMELIPIFGMWADKIMQFEKDGKKLEEAVAEFEEKFRPGEEDGIMDSIFVSWMYLDLRFGTSLETVGDRLLSDSIIKKFNEPGLTFIRQLNESYLTFFEIIEASDSEDITIAEELGTGDRFTILHVREIFEIEPRAGEIWYTRRIGPPDSSIFFTSPYFFIPEGREGIKQVLKMQEESFSRGPYAELFPPEQYFAESQKQSGPFWVSYILYGADSQDTEEFEPDYPEFPVLITTDREKILFAEMHFRIRDEDALRKRMAKLRSFRYDKSDDSWIWLKAKSRKYPDKPRTILGFLRVKDGELIAETNSKERAAKLRRKLKKHLGDNIAYVKTMYQDPDDFPELSPEEIEAQRKKSKELNERPEVQAALKKQLEHHYFIEWPETKLPALGGTTPLDAVKDDVLRPKVLALIEELEERQASPKFEMPKIDLNKLRKKLGLPPREN